MTQARHRWIEASCGGGPQTPAAQTVAVSLRGTGGPRVRSGCQVGVKYAVKLVPSRCEVRPSATGTEVSHAAPLDL